MKNLGYEKNLGRFGIRKIDKSRCKEFFCLEEKLGVEARMREGLQSNW